MAIFYIKGERIAKREKTMTLELIYIIELAAQIRDKIIELKK